MFKDFEAKTQEERDTCAREISLEYGREDVLLVGYPERGGRWDDYIDGLAENYGSTRAIVQIAYEQGRKEAEQEKQQNPALFYLKELQARIGVGEMYGPAFDIPEWIIEQVIALVQKHQPGE